MPRPQLKEIVARLTLVVVSCSLMLLAGELVLRRMIGPSDDTPLQTSSADPFVPRLFPSTRALRYGVEIRTNALGLRGPEVTERDSDGRARIVCLGDSYTFGTGVLEEQTIPARLAKRLDAEVINAGIEGANAYDNEARLLHVALDLEPDVVVLFYLFNDVYRMERGREWMAARRRDPEAARRAHDERDGRSLVLEYLRSRLAGVVRRTGSRGGRLDVWNEQYRDGNPAWEETRASLLAMRDACAEKDVAFVLALLPAFAHFTDDAYPLPDYRREVVAFCQESGIVCVDLHAPFWGTSGRGYWINPLDPHPDADACALMADAVAGALAPLLDSP